MSIDEKSVEEQAAAYVPPIVPTEGSQPATHIGLDELPWVEVETGVEFQLLHVDLTQGLWISRDRLAPGVSVEKHFHTGAVFGVTHSGSWHYKEYPEDVNTAGSYLLEPAGSVHTLTVPASNTEPTIVWFAIYGANVNMDDQDTITSIVDARLILNGYRAYCEAMNLDIDKLIVIGE